MSRPGDRPAALPDRALWVNGRLVRGADATLSLFDRGTRDGEGLFETLRVEGGKPHFWLRHLERLVLSCAELGFPVPPAPAVLRAALEGTLAENGLAEAAARITVTRGVPGNRPTRTGCWIEVEPLAGRLWSRAARKHAAAVFSRVPFAPSVITRHKTTSRLAYHLAREEARAARADEALLVSAAGQVLEGTVTNVFAVVAGEVLTPPLAAEILPGVMRRVVLERALAAGIPVREARLTPADLVEADEVFLTNAIQRVVPLGRLGGRAWTAAPIAERLLAALDSEPVADNPLGTPLRP